MATILVADDDPDILHLIDLKLQLAGHEVVLAADGEQALQAIARQHVDLVLLDSMMPRVTGPQVLAVIRADPATQAIPVIMISALTSEDDVALGMTSGATDYLPKPFSPRALMVRITALLEATV